MTVQQIIDEVRQICQETDANNTHASDNVIIGWINDAVLQLCANISTLPKQEITGITSDDTITLSQNLLILDYVSILKDNRYYNLETIDFVNFSRLNKDWQNTERNQPKFLVRMTDTQWMLYPYPSNEWKNLPMTLIGSVKPSIVSSPSDVPAISITLHQSIVHYCAWKFFNLLNNPIRANAEFMAFDTFRKMNMQTATSTTGSLLSFKYRGGV